MRLIELRKKKGKNQAEVAKFINVSQVAYSKYETGKSEPSYDILTKLADYFDVSVDYILGRDEMPTLKIPKEYKDLQVAFYDGIKDLKQEDIDELVKFMEYLKSKKK